MKDTVGYFKISIKKRFTRKFVVVQEVDRNAVTIMSLVLQDVTEVKANTRSK